MVTVSSSLPTWNAVRLTPLMQIEPFSITSAANCAGKRKRYNQLPSRVCFSIQVAVVSTWPCTKWPSRRSPIRSARSMFIRLPFSQLPRLVFASVSATAVTLYCVPVMSTTVRQTPLCATLWSTFSSAASGLSIMKWMLEPSVVHLGIYM